MAKTPRTRPPKKSEPFRHTVRELVVLNQAHATMMANINAGRRYDVLKRAWVDEQGNVIA